MAQRRVATAVAGLVLIASLARADVLSPPALRVHTQSFANGLRLVLAPDPWVTSVVVHVRYEQGAGAETPAQAGFTHLVEKLFALGTVHTKPGEHEARIDAAGGWTTSSTTLDDLRLVTQVPAGALELALWLEAERMAGLADGITEAGFEQARDAIAAAFRAAYIDRPYALAERAVRQALWPHGHPNRNDVLGDGVALDHATLDAARAFVRDRIQPGKATLVIAGNFDVGRARRLVRRYFGWIPGTHWSASANIPFAVPDNAPHAPGEIEITDAVPKVVIAYSLGDLGRLDATADVIAHMLAGDRDSRLQRALVDTALATDVRADVLNGGDELQIHVTPVTGADLTQLAATARDQVAALANAGIMTSPHGAAEVERAYRAVEVRRLQVIENLSGRARLFATGSSAFATRLVRSTAGIDSKSLARWRAKLRDARAVTVIARGATP